MRAGLARGWAVMGLAVIGLAALAVEGCFNPDKPACAFSCAVAPHTCPAGYVCGADELCHNPNSTAVCLIDLVDASSPDGSDTGADALDAAAGGDAGADADR